MPSGYILKYDRWVVGFDVHVSQRVVGLRVGLVLAVFRSSVVSRKFKTFLFAFIVILTPFSQKFG